MKLYYSPGACSLASHIVLEWIGQPYQAIRLSREERQAPEYLRVNPAGAVPALDDDGWVLTQNVAVLRYLAEIHPSAGLDGDGTPRGRAEVNRWLAFANADVHPAFHPLFGTTAYLGEGAAELTRQAARRKLRTYFERLDRQLLGRTWVTGQRSLADAYLFVVTRWARAMEVDLSGLAEVHRYYDHLRLDPAVRHAMAAEGID